LQNPKELFFMFPVEISIPNRLKNNNVVTTIYGMR